jgi:hypothetical protein
MPAPKPFVSASALASQRLNAFYAALGDGGHTEQTVSQLFEAAAQAGVVLDKAEYKPARDVAGRFDTYTIVMPVKGDYSSLRRFSAIVLAKVPYAALDDMRFKRNSASDHAIEANLRFTVFLRTATWEPVAERALISALASAPALASAVASMTASATASATATPSVPAQAPSSAVVHLELPPTPPSMASTTKSTSAHAPAAIRTLSASLQTRTPAAEVRR